MTSVPCLVCMPRHTRRRRRRRYDRNHHYQVFFCTEQWGNWEVLGRSLHYYRHYYHQIHRLLPGFWNVFEAQWSGVKEFLKGHCYFYARTIKKSGQPKMSYLVTIAASFVRSCYLEETKTWLQDVTF